MVFNETAAAYGLFQVVFAEMHEYLAAATYHLRRRNEQSLQYEKVHRQGFEKTLKQFRKQLCQLSDSGGVAEGIEALKKACDSMACLAQWRNERVHARVLRTEEGLELYAPLRDNPGKAQRLEMSKGFFEERIREAIKVTVTFQAAHLISQIRMKEEIDRLWASLPADPE